jgi:hypothetical protein
MSTDEEKLLFASFLREALLHKGKGKPMARAMNHLESMIEKIVDRRIKELLAGENFEEKIAEIMSSVIENTFKQG